MTRDTRSAHNPRTVSRRRRTAGRLLVLVMAAAVLVGMSSRAAAAASVQSQGISSGAAQQIAALFREKAARTEAERKISSRLLYAARQSRGQPVAAGIQQLETGVDTAADGTVEVEISTTGSSGLASKLKRRGIAVLDTVARFDTVRARITLDQLAVVAAYAEVIFVRPAPAAMGSGSAALPGTERQPGRASGPVDSEGDVTHRATRARAQLGVDGSGVRVCVLGDGVDSLARQQAAGELPAVSVLPGQAGSGDQGTAMLEIVHDLAPGARLFFAGTGGATIARFAQNILDLRFAYSCDVLVDGVDYFDETPFQTGQAATVVSPTNGGAAIEAVNTVTAQGALYVSSSGDAGSLDGGTSSTWEGDFVDGGQAIIPFPPAVVGRWHDFDPGPDVTVYNTIGPSSRNPGVLFWSDPLGASTNDYDLFVLDATGSAVVASSTDWQAGSLDPIESVPGAAMEPGNRIVVVQVVGAANRFLHLAGNGSRLAFGTAGASSGHHAAATAFSVAATPAAGAAGPPPNPSGPFPSPFNAANRVELFSSDGPRQVFFNADGTPITPGNLLAGGGRLLPKPDATAADGVSTGLTSTPGYSPFFGTAASAAHAAAIAALMKSATPALTAGELRAYLATTAIDIQAAGADRDSGAGIVDAYSAVDAAVPALTRWFPLISRGGDKETRRQGEGVTG